MIQFEWNEKKAASNFRKHGVSFEEAKSVFYDENAIQFYDEDHSELEEDRFLLLGRSIESRILITCYCERESDNVLRIISARKATKKERQYYPGKK